MGRRWPRSDHLRQPVRRCRASLAQFGSGRRGYRRIPTGSLRDRNGLSAQQHTACPRHAAAQEAGDGLLGGSHTRSPAAVAWRVPERSLATRARTARAGARTLARRKRQSWNTYHCPLRSTFHAGVCGTCTLQSAHSILVPAGSKLSTVQCIPSVRWPLGVSPVHPSQRCSFMSQLPRWLGVPLHASVGGRCPTHAQDTQDSDLVDPSGNK
jgi:hypothetical protein